jgi:RNA polymerase sigma-70 factor (ECF subfamily)
MTMAEIGASSYRRFQQPQEAALDQILITYSDALVRFAYSMVHSSAAAEDIAAESIAIFLTKHKKFRDEGHLRAYLYQIARYKCVDYLRLHSRLVALEDVENVLGGSDPADDMLQKERNEAIYRCMQALPAQYRQVLQLAYFDAFSAEDICRIIGKTRKQVYNLLARGKASLKELLEKEGITYADI